MVLGVYIWCVYGVVYTCITGVSHLGEEGPHGGQPRLNDLQGPEPEKAPYLEGRRKEDGRRRKKEGGRRTDVYT